METPSQYFALTNSSIIQEHRILSNMDITSSLALTLIADALPASDQLRSSDELHIKDPRLRSEHYDLGNYLGG
jgi:hypothetical protein